MNSSIFIILLTCLITVNANAQLGLTRSEVIKNNGSNYKTDISQDGVKFITYVEEFETEASGKYDRHTSYFFIEIKGKEFCYVVRILEPSSETNAWVKYLNEKFVKLDYLVWKDYETEALYKLEIDDDFCMLNLWWDIDKR